MLGFLGFGFGVWGLGVLGVLGFGFWVLGFFGFWVVGKSPVLRLCASLSVRLP